MRKVQKNLVTKSLVLLFLILPIFSLSSDYVYDISTDVPGNTDYKKVEFESDESTTEHFFKHIVSDVPKSKINAFRIDFDSFGDTSKKFKVVCTFVAQSASDADLINQLRNLGEENSACRGGLSKKGVYDGIFEYHDTNKKLGIYLYTEFGIYYTATVYLRIAEKFLPVEERTYTVQENLSLVPLTVTISDYREFASKVLFYSHTRNLQMYYAVGDATYPEKLFAGNVMSVYTNPNMVRQKYHNANYMTLLTRNFTDEDTVSELFKLEIRFFSSNYLLDYFVSDNPEGRTKNYPLSINMTECSSPYYVILNYNKAEKKVLLYIDQIYGKVKSLSVAPTFSKIKWDDMLQYDMVPVDFVTRKADLPAYSDSHIDVYKIECEIPLLLNFYYVDESEKIPLLNYGVVAISSLKPYKTETYSFEKGVSGPLLTIEIFNPVKLPLVYVSDGQNEQLIFRNTLIKSTPFSTTNPIVIKERRGDSDTRVIIKVGYNTGSWSPVGDYVKYNQKLNMYAFSFPSDLSKLNYTSASIITSGKTAGDNIKYCYATNIGSAILPSKENCYRVSLDNSYTLKVLNPLVMYKDYVFDTTLNFYVSLQPVTDEQMDVRAELTTYNTDERNLENTGHSVTLDSSGKRSSILTAPIGKQVQISVQVKQCKDSNLKMEIVNAYDPSETLLPETKVEGDTFYKTFTNNLLESEINLSGDANTNVFIKHAGIRSGYNPGVKESTTLSFNDKLNQLIVENPLNVYERMKYVVFVDKTVTDKDITLCSIAEGKQLTNYNKTVLSYNEQTPIIINFNKVGLNPGESFQAIVYTEQLMNTRLAFLSTVYSGVVGDVKTDSFTEINLEYDKEYVYAKATAQRKDLLYYFTYMPDDVLDVPVGAFSIVVDNINMQDFTGVFCAFADEGDDPISMIEAVEDVVENDNSYCIGGRSTVKKERYNFIFRYSYTKDKRPRKLVIRLSNGKYAEGDFTIYVRKGKNDYLNHTDFDTELEYGKSEEYKLCVMPYIVDLSILRGDTNDYVSKVLIYSQYFEMEMYYLDSTEETNKPIKLFGGNIMLVYTKLTLAEQKYHATKLVLLSEALTGQNHPSLGNQFRFHTKMFQSDAQIEYFVSNNPSGRTLNRQISLDMNICSATNNKFYYILNYNKAEDSRILYLDTLFGKVKKARIATDISAEKWSELVSSKMTEIKDCTTTIGNSSQHLDVVELECSTPLLANIYYNSENQVYSGLKLGDIAMKNLAAGEDISISLDTSAATIGTFYSISVYNPNGNPDVSVTYGSSVLQMKENSVKTSILLSSNKEISISNNGKTSSRFIFKIGYGVESQWHDEEVAKISGKVYSLENKFVYKFPFDGSKRNFTNVTINVKPMTIEGELAENIKFCFSKSVGMAIGVSYENCFRTGKNIPYSLTFVNPLIITKDYKDYTDFYYVTFSPYYDTEYISLEIKENKYSVSERNIEGVGNIVTIPEQANNVSTILTVPELSSNNNIMVQLQICKLSSTNMMSYQNLNAYTGEYILNGTVRFLPRFYTYVLENNFMETQLRLTGLMNDKMFIKHIGTTKSTIQPEEYRTEFDPNQNVATIYKPLLNTVFRMTVLVSRKGKMNSITLCDFAEKSESQYSELADYVYTFTSNSSNVIPHFIDFRSFSYKEGDEFSLLVYAVQTTDEKLEFLYSVTNGVVGKIQGPVEIEGTIPGKPDFATQVFTQNTTNNYLFYNFDRDPLGNVSFISIKTVSSDETIAISKLGCTFVQKGSTDEDMITAVNNAMKEGKSVCYGETQVDNKVYKSLVNAKDVSNSYKKLVIQIIYNFSDEKKQKIVNNPNAAVSLNVTLRINGFKVDKENYGYNEDETLTSVPYVFDLEEIRNLSPTEYVSKVLIYSNTREMQMFYLNEGAPVSLFSGNIMLVYTNKDVIKEKYYGATTMILLTDALSSKGTSPMGERYRFKVNFFKSSETIQYYVSANPEGRLLNNPTSIEMTSCDQPYYYILNYHVVEDERILHIDTLFGDINTVKIATTLTVDDWYDLVSKMEEFSGSQYLIKKQTKYHIDVLEVTCQTPLSLNIYYTDPYNPKKSNLEEGDISLITLPPGMAETFSFKGGLTGDFIYSFTILRESDKPPYITLSLEGSALSEEIIRQNGIYLYPMDKRLRLANLKNRDLSGSDETKLIFKYGYSIEKTFTKIENDMYNLQSGPKNANLFAYIFKSGDDRLNYTKVNFTVSTKEDNVKFCYSTNLGSYIDPSLHNCFRVGKSNPYTITVLNPYIMYKSYYSNYDLLEYYVAFRTEEITQNITITPTLVSYVTKIRNMEGVPNTLNITNSGSTILSIPSNKTAYVFVQMHVCTPDKSINYEFRNAYYNTSLGAGGEIQANTKNYYKNIENTYLDTELVLNFTKRDKADFFVKHVGIDSQHQPVVRDINISYDPSTFELSFNQPIDKEAFNYTIYLDKKENLKKKSITLCTIATLSKISHYTYYYNSDKSNNKFKLDFEKEISEEYESFDVLILAEEFENGKLMVLSNVYQYDKNADEGSVSTALIIILILLAIILIVGGGLIYICLRRLQNKPMENVIIAKPTNLDDISSANKGEKMLESMANSQASETP